MELIAQQFVDASVDGGGAFILFALMVFAFVAILFAADSIRRRASGDDEDEPARGDGSS